MFGHLVVLSFGSQQGADLSAIAACDVFAVNGLQCGIGLRDVRQEQRTHVRFFGHAAIERDFVDGLDGSRSHESRMKTVRKRAKGNVSQQHAGGQDE